MFSVTVCMSMLFVAWWVGYFVEGLGTLYGDATLGFTLNFVYTFTIVQSWLVGRLLRLPHFHWLHDGARESLKLQTKKGLHISVPVLCKLLCIFTC